MNNLEDPIIMSKENLESFLEKVASSEELQAAIGDEIDAEALIKLGEENGFDFSRDELRETSESVEEISEEDLAGVTGGVRKVWKARGRFSLEKAVKQQLGSRSPRRQGLGVVVNVGGNWYEEPEA